jgi:hypothetical protein
MVTLRFIGNGSIMQSTLFETCVNSCKKVEKLELEDLKLDLDTLGKISSLFDNANNKKFVNRVKHIILNNIEFEGNSEIKKDFIVSKFIQVLCKFPNIEILDF